MMKKTHHTGFTLIEILIVVTILALLILATIFSLTRQRQKAEDTKVKTDLARLKIAFEDYYNDNHCYPPTTWFDGPEDCGSAQMQPYLAAIMCDSHTGLPYVLEKDATGCGSFKLYGDLLLPESDPQALALCGPSGSSLGNYGVSSSNVAVTIACGEAVGSATPTPSPSLSPTPAPSTSTSPSSTPGPTADPTRPYYCQDIDNCSSFDTARFSCTPAYEDPFCSHACNTTVSHCLPIQ